MIYNAVGSSNIASTTTATSRHHDHSDAAATSSSSTSNNKQSPRRKGGGVKRTATTEDDDYYDKYHKRTSSSSTLFRCSQRRILLLLHDMKRVSFVYYVVPLLLLVLSGFFLGQWIGQRYHNFGRRGTASSYHSRSSAKAMLDRMLYHRGSSNNNGGDVNQDAETNNIIDNTEDNKDISLLQSQSSRHLERSFERHRNMLKGGRITSSMNQVLLSWLQRLDRDIVDNVSGGIRWIRPYLLPTLGGDDDTAAIKRRITERDDKAKFLKVRRMNQPKMKWQEEYEQMLLKQQEAEDPLSSKSTIPGPIVDYTDPSRYTYPQLVDNVPPTTEYPILKPLKELIMNWNHDEDYEGSIHETLMHFDYNDPKQMEIAKQFRDAEIPFKVVNVSELLEADHKWTDEYVAKHFKPNGAAKSSSLSSSALSWLTGGGGDGKDEDGNIPLADGIAQESPNNYFAFFTPRRWDIDRMGLPPTRNNDWDYRTWAQHARYADAVRLTPEKPHFYWQSGVDREERYQDPSQWTFISRDLPSFSSPTETFFVFNPDQQKGIQCRFGERGVVAATHYDSGRNCVGMITGAKRYILSPPRECSKLGIFTSRHSPIYRHSLLNFAHIAHLDDRKASDSGMSDEERHWLERASQAQSVETVLKSGEVLYIPSHWFHYIISLQKSAQCNVRSGIDYDGHTVFGNRETVEQCKDYE